jgi:hypothetical protein
MLRIALTVYALTALATALTLHYSRTVTTLQMQMLLKQQKFELVAFIIIESTCAGLAVKERKTTVL